jgi:hypothetical protein
MPTAIASAEAGVTAAMTATAMAATPTVGSITRAGYQQCSQDSSQNNRFSPYAGYTHDFLHRLLLLVRISPTFTLQWSDGKDHHLVYMGS